VKIRRINLVGLAAMMRVINDYGILCEKVLRAVTSEGEHEMSEYHEDRL
jgi:hypothetical protein